MLGRLGEYLSQRFISYSMENSSWIRHCLAGCYSTSWAKWREEECATGAVRRFPPTLARRFGPALRVCISFRQIWRFRVGSSCSSSTGNMFPVLGHFAHIDVSRWSSSIAQYTNQPFKSKCLGSPTWLTTGTQVSICGPAGSHGGAPAPCIPSGIQMAYGPRG